MLSYAELSAILPGTSDTLRRRYLYPLNEAMKAYQINTPHRIAAFLAQIAHESGGFRYVKELADGSAYEYRKDLGNLANEALFIAHSLGTTTGRFYKGRGLIQITGFYNYKACGKALNLDLIYNPELLQLPKYAALSAAWFWETHGCNELADMQLFKKITKRINGGYNGYLDRLNHYERACKILIQKGNE